MKHIAPILILLLTSFYVSPTNADEPKASSPTPRVNNVWGAKNEWINNYRQQQSRQTQANQRYMNQNGWLNMYNRPSRSNHYYYRPLIIQQYGYYPMYYNQGVHLRCNNQGGGGFGIFFMNLR